VLGISNIERALNGIWGIQKDRTWARRLPDYLAVLLIAPLLLVTALSLATTLKSQWLVQRLLDVPVFSVAYHAGLQYAPIVVLSLAFAFLYWFLPNTRVRVVAALLGGIVAGVLVTLAQGAYLGFSIGAARAHALFGGFAQIPLLFVWIYVFWAIVLFGAEVAYAFQTLALYRREVRGRRAGPAEREAIGLRIAVEVARTFRDGATLWTADALSDVLRVPLRTIRDVLSHLEAAGIVAGRGAQDEGGFQLGRPAESIAVTDALVALRGPREPVADGSPIGASVESVLAEIDSGEARAAGGRTLADLLGDSGGLGAAAPSARFG
jgi:membrane protein